MYTFWSLAFSIWSLITGLACQSPKAPVEVETPLVQVDSSLSQVSMKPISPLSDHLVSPEIKALVKAMGSGDSVKILCYGNSITYGFAVDGFGQVSRPYPQVLETLLQNHFQNPNIQVINEGHSGWTSDQAMKNGDFFVRQHQPDLVIVMFGINDVYNGFSLSYYKQRMLTLIRNTGFLGVPSMILTPTPILTDYDAALNEYLPALKQMAQSLHLGFLDINQAIREQVKSRELDWKIVLPDEVHFGDYYYTWIAEELFLYFKSVKPAEQKAGE